VDKASILLISGGVESVTLLFQLVEAGEQVQALFVDYAQRAAKQERAAADANCAHLGVELVPLDLASVGETFRNVQARKAHIPLPHRNLVALALGVSYAANLGSTRLYLAANGDDTTAYPSSSHAFLAQFRLMMGLLGDVQLVTPYIGLTKSEVVDRGRQLGVDYETTYSCMIGYGNHCGRCPQCLKRKAAFRDAGVSEPPGFYRV